MSNVKEILQELGFNLRDDNNGWRSNAIFRGGTNQSSLKIYDNGWFIDWTTGVTGSLKELIKLTLGLTNLKDVDSFLEKNKFSVDNINRIDEKPVIKISKIYPPEILNELIPDHSYWLNRSITIETLRLFKGGLALTGKYKNYYVFPIFNGSKEIIGFTGRRVFEYDKMPKYKHMGAKKEFVWPAFLNLSIIRQKKEVILVESPACVLKMWDCGVQNVLCLFGTELQLGLLNFLLRVDPDRVIISTNNEESQTGNRAADKIAVKLRRYFDAKQILTVLPSKKDFAEMTQEEIKEWLKIL